MRVVFGIVVIVVVGWIAFNFLSTGEFALLPQGQLSDEEQSVRRLNGEFLAAKREYHQAGRAVALSGVDTSSAAAAALHEVDRIEQEAQRLAGTVTSDAAREQLHQLLRDIEQYRRDIS